MDPDIPRKVKALMKGMRLEEKLGQMSQYSGFDDTVKEHIARGRAGSLLNIHGAKDINEAQRLAVEESRLKIPLIIGNDIIHGYRTIFPIPLAEAATFDPGLMTAAARVAAVEGRAAGTHWTFAPMCDIARDPRWGRIAEGAGEDPYLGRMAAAARVKGFQGRKLSDDDALAACAKHFAGYGASESGRDFNSANQSPRAFEEIHFPPFREAVKAGCETFMCAYIDINGTPATASKWLFTEVLRKRWGFRGFVVSDWKSVYDLITHGVAATRAEAGKLAVDAGVDMDMTGDVYIKDVAALVRTGRIDRALIDECVRRILTTKFRLGLFERPYADPALEAAVTLAPAHLELAREAARHSFVLLRNEGGILPIPPEAKTIAVVGPLADDHEAPLGCWSARGKKEEVVSVLEGIKARARGARVLYAGGCEPAGDSEEGIAEAVAAAQEADLVVAVVGEPAWMSGEANCRSVLDLPGKQEALLKALKATGKPVALVLFNGRPMSLPWAAENIPAILVAWHGGVMAGHAVADALFGDFNPCGKLPATFPRRVGQVPIYYARFNTCRPSDDNNNWSSKWLDCSWKPQWPFGFGLSYTKFVYSDLKLSSKRMSMRGKLEVSARVTNAGSRVGSEVVQLYIQDVVGSATRPVKELKGFTKIRLAPGEGTTVSFTVRPADLAFPGVDLKPVVEPGQFKVWIGPDSDSGLEGAFELK
jgi:beta-glucosidase